MATGQQKDKDTKPEETKPVETGVTPEQLADLLAQNKELLAKVTTLSKQNANLTTALQRGDSAPRGPGHSFVRTMSREANAEEKFMKKIFPEGTVFALKRSRYANGRFWQKGELSPPLKKAGPPPGPNWKVHRIPEDDQPPSTMSEMQTGGAQKPEGA